jgi:hypothetical protein
MEHTALHRRLPRAGIDAVDDAESALAMIALAIEHPLRHETIVVVLDEARCGRTVVVVDGTEQPDAVIDIVECITQADEHIGAIVVCSVRPTLGDPGTGADADDVTDADIDRWLEMSEIAELVGVEVLEWFVVGRTISCPRDLLGEPPRW